MNENSRPELDIFFAALDERKAEGVVALDVRGISAVADYMVICSGRSNRQVSAIAETVAVYLKKRGRKALGIEGEKDGQWVLLDYGDVIMHVFYEPVRGFYDLEGLWADAPRIRPSSKEEC